ncbi:MAG: hypothetical protein V5A21_06410 [Halapricum sp.]
MIDDPRREVPRIRAYVHTNHKAVENGAKPKRKPDIYKIPRSMWARVEAARDARRQVERQLGGKYPVWVTTDNNGEKKVVVEQFDDGSLSSADIQSLDEQVPAKVNGVAGRQSRFGKKSRYAQKREIPVDIERPRKEVSKNGPTIISPDERKTRIQSEWDGTIEIDANHYLSEYDEVPGGAAMSVVGFKQDGSGTVGLLTGTTGTPANHNGSKVLITAGHNTGDIERNSIDIAADGVWVDEKISYKISNGMVSDWENEDLSIGERVVEEWCDDNDRWTDALDAGILHSKDAEISQGLADDNGGYRIGVWGGLSRQRLYDLQDVGSDAALYKQGATTGHDSCYISDVNDHSFKYNLDGGNSTENGDSGGPIYEESTISIFGWEIEVALIGGLHKGTVRGWYDIATGISAIEDKFGVTV